MQIIEDLLAAYKEYIGLPLHLIPLSNEGATLLNPDTMDAEYGFIYSSLADTNDLKIPSIITTAGKGNQQNVYYIISPKFKVQLEDYILLAGPYIQGASECKEITTIPPLETPLIIEKFKTLYAIITAKNSFENSYLMSKELIDIFQQNEWLINDYSNTIDPIDYVLQQLINLKHLDFVGCVTPSKDFLGMYTVTSFFGDSNTQLIGKQFYLGEGILGESLLKREHFYWKKTSQNRYIEFFQEQGLLPEKMFGIPILNNNYSEVLIFGGSFSKYSDELREEDLYLINNVVKTGLQKKQVKDEMKSLLNLQDKFKESLQLINKFYSSSDVECAFELMKFCQNISSQGNVILTLPNNQMVVQNEYTPHLIKSHEQFIQLDKQRPYLMQRKEDYLHLYVKGIGSCSIELSRTEDFVKEGILLSSLLKILYESKNEVISSNAIFDAYYAAQIEFNPKAEQQTKIAIKLVGILVEKGLIDEECARVIINLCKIFSYSGLFIERHLKNSVEYEIYHHLANCESFLYDEKIEKKFLLFADKVIFKTNHFEKNSLSDYDFSFFNKYYEQEFVALSEGEINQAALGIATIQQQKVAEKVEALNISLREKEVLILLLKGMSNQQIATQLIISTHTVKNHITNIFKKMGVTDRYHAMAKIL